MGFSVAQYGLAPRLKVQEIVVGWISGKLTVIILSFGKSHSSKSHVKNIQTFLVRFYPSKIPSKGF